MADELSREFFAKMYDTLPEYVNRRDVNSYSSRRIELEATHFKIPYLVSVLPSLSHIESMAEIGCATGELIGNFPADSHVRKTAFDVSPKNIETARQRFPSVRFLEEDFRNSRETFDIVILSDVLEHVLDDVEFLRDAAQHARIVLVNLPLEDSAINWFRKYGPEDESGHLRKYSASDGYELFRKAGLRVISSQQIWIHETDFEQQRRVLMKQFFGQPYTGNALVRAVKAGITQSCRQIPLIGRRILISNLFASLEQAAR